MTTTARTSLALRRAALALLSSLAFAIAVACGAGEPVIGQPTSGPSRTAAGAPGDGTGDRGPTADIEIDPVPAEPTRTFPPGGPVPCDDKFEQPLCFPLREVSPQTLYRELAERSWDCYREGQKDDAGLEVSDTFECSGTQGKVGQISLHHSISANTYESKKSGSLEEISVVATAAEIGDGSGPKPTDRHVQKHSVRAFTFMLKRIWGNAHPDGSQKPPAHSERCSRTAEPSNHSTAASRHPLHSCQWATPSAAPTQSASTSKAKPPSPRLRTSTPPMTTPPRADVAPVAAQTRTRDSSRAQGLCPWGTPRWFGTP